MLSVNHECGPICFVGRTLSQMRIAHLCLSNWFVDGFAYQENDLVRQHVYDGHDVLIIASTEVIDSTGKLSYVEPASYVSCEGARIIRVAYRRMLPRWLIAKVRSYFGVARILNEFKPDSILFHGACAWELLTVCQYIKKNPIVRFYVDSHEDFHNSARGFFSRELLHRAFYGRVLRRSLPSIRKVLCYSTESLEFVRLLYGIERSKLELFPLGGFVVPETEYHVSRNSIRHSLGLADNDVMVLIAGKQTRRKKILACLDAFARNRDQSLRLYVVGSVEKEIEKEFFQLVKADSRIFFLGWKSSDELNDLLCAADIYLQPGTQSVTMQKSLCSQCAVILDDYPSHRFYVSDNGWLIGRDGLLSEIFEQVKNSDIKQMKANSVAFAREHLDYSVLAQRILT